MEKIAKENLNLANLMKNKKYFSAGLTIFILVIILTGYSLDYRLGGKFLIGKMGTVETSIPLLGTSIYIDQSKKITTSKDEERVEVKLSPRLHTVIISKDGYLPWKKDVEVPSNKKIILSPLFVSINQSGLIITKQDPEYTKIKKSILTLKLPSKSSPLTSKDSTTTLWIEDNAIVAQSGSTTSVVIQPDSVIENVDFYKGRSDSVIFSMSNSIYVIEIDKNGTQNFMPIYKGQKPTFIVNDENSIYVNDGNNLMQIGL